MDWVTGWRRPMPFRLELRDRVALGFALLGAGICLVVAVGLDLATDELQQRLLEDTLSAELLEARDHVTLDPGRPLPATATIRTYVIPGSNAGPLPPGVSSLPLGFGEIQLDGRIYATAVAQVAECRFIVLYDKTALARHERRLHLFLTVGILVMGLFSALGGRWLAAAVIAPVTQLARRVGELPPGERGGGLALDFAHDQVGELARALDDYTERLAAAMEREQSFTGDVSHELRNPLTVIQGAVDVLQATPDMPSAAARPLERIARAVATMDELSGVLLALARDDAPRRAERSAFLVDELVRELVDGYRAQVRGTPIALELRVEESLRLAADRAALRIAVGNLVRNACFHVRQGLVRVRVNRQGVLVEDSGAGLDAGEIERILTLGHRGPDSRGVGLGLALVRRLCERHGWSLTLDSAKGQGTRAWIRLDSVPAET